MGMMSNEELRKYCHTLEEYSVEDLKSIITKAEWDSMPRNERGFGLLIIPDFIKVCQNCLQKNSAKVSAIIKKSHSSLADVVYDLALVIGPQLIQNGEIKSMTVVVAALLVIGKKGYEKYLL